MRCALAFATRRERLLERPLAAPEHDELRGQADDLARDLDREVDALLVREPAHHAEQRHARLVRQAEPLLQRLLVERLRGEPVGVVALRDQPVGRGIPLGDVDAVRDAVQHAAARGEQPVHAEAERLVLDLARVARAHGRDRVGVLQSALEERQAAPELDAVDREGRGRQPEPRHLVAAGRGPGTRGCGSSSPSPRARRPRSADTPARARSASRCSGARPAASRAGSHRPRAAPRRARAGRSAARCPASRRRRVSW